jgi:glycosyltransferase involved in cell wall biosynthesis
LAEIMRRWLADPAERLRLGRGAAERAEAFSAERMIEGYAELFGRLASVWTPTQAMASKPADVDGRVGVLIFHPANVFGGAERTIVNLLTHLRRDRVRVVLVGMPEVFRDPAADVFYSLEALGLNPGGFATLRRSLGEARRLVSIARREDCRVMLGMLHHGAIVAAMCRVVSGFRLKTIASPRTPSVEGIRFHVGEVGKTARLWRMMISGFCRIADRLIVASEGLKQECVGVFGAKAKRVRVIPNCVDDAMIRLAHQTPPRVRDQATAEQPWVVVAAGRLAPEKDMGTLIRAFALLREHLEARLDIIGSGPEQEGLEALAQALSVGSSVRFVGFTPDPLEQIRGADVFVHTGLFEGFGNSLLEAMASGVALVATDCDFGPREIVQDGVTGVLVRVSDPHHLAEVLERLLRDPAARLRMVENALRHVGNYRAELMAGRYEEVFLELGLSIRHG